MANDRWGGKSLGLAFTLATHMASAVAVGYFLGAFLDKLLGTKPWLSVIFLIFGVATGIKMMYETAFSEEMTASEQESSDSERKKP